MSSVVDLGAADISPGTADAVLNALPLPVVIVDPDGKIADANVAAENFFEVSLMLLRRQVLRELVPFGSPLLAQRRRRGALAGGEIARELAGKPRPPLCTAPDHHRVGA